MIGADLRGKARLRATGTLAREALATGALATSVLVTGVLAGCGAPPAPPPAQPRCPEVAKTAAPVTATSAAAPDTTAPAANELPKVQGFELDKVGSPQKVPLVKVAANGAGPSSYAVVPASNGGAWLVPESVSAKQPILLVEASGAASEPWVAPVRAQLWAARDTGGGAWILGEPAAPGVFGFAHVERLFRLSADGRITSDHPFTSGMVKPHAAATDAAGNLHVLGTLAGPLTSAKGIVTPEAGGRAEVLSRVAPSGAVEWATALERASGQAASLAVAPDGSSVVTSSPFLGDQVLTAFSPQGLPTWKKALSPVPPVSFPTPWISFITSDGKDGFFVSGPLNEGGGFDLGLGALTGEGTFVARLDAKGQAAWEKRLPGPESWEVTGDGAGSVLAFQRVEARLAAYVIDASGAITRALESDLPPDCRQSATEVLFKAALTTAHVLFAVTCQPLDDRYMPPAPRGKPTLYVGSLSRK
jgi:hypothetical protein